MKEEKDLSIPGSTYVKLMAHTPVAVQPGELQPTLCCGGTDLSLLTYGFPVLASAFELFLASLVKEEMSQMPRGVHFSAMRGGTLSAALGKTVAGIPAFMLKTYEKNKQPGLKSGLTGDNLHLLPF